MSTVPFSREVEELLHHAFMGARNASHATMTVEHLALELLKNDDVVRYLRSCGTDVDRVTETLQRALSKIPLVRVDGDAVYTETQPSSEFQAVMERSIEDTKKDRLPDILLRDIFLAILDQNGSCAASALIEATPRSEVFEDLRKARKESNGAV